MKKLLLILLLLTLQAKVFAQPTINQFLKDETKKEIIERIGQLQDFLYCMTNENTDSTKRAECGMAALKLFVGNGSPYTLAGVAHSGATIQLSSINSHGLKSSRTMSANTYIHRLLALSENGRRVKCDIKSATIFLLAKSTLELVGDSLYKVECWICRYDPNDKTIRYYDLVQKYVITQLNICEPLPDEIILLDGVNISESYE
jgi:hypothetical protein